MKINELVKELVDSREGKLTFSIGNVSRSLTSTGNVRLKAVCDNGKVVSFWSSNMDELITETDPSGLYEVQPGVTTFFDNQIGMDVLVKDPKRKEIVWS